MANLYPIYGDTAASGGFISTFDADESPALFAKFDPGCSLTQVSSDGWIFTGPIVFNSDIADIQFLVLPGGRPYAYVNAAGVVIPVPMPGEAFFIRTPFTPETYLLTLYAYVNNCDQGFANGQGLMCDPCMTAAAATPHMMMMMTGRSSAYAEPNLPDCYLVYDRLAFYINQRPVKCAPRRCITMPGTVAAASGTETIRVGCCNCG